jgi:hypothetical protein
MSGLTVETETRGGCRSVGGRIGATLFLSIFLLMGSLFAVFILGEAIRQTMVWFWPSAPCTIIESGVDTSGADDNPYSPTILFEYEVGGRVYRSTTVSRGETSSSSYDSARRPSDRYPPGSDATCWVHPKTPSIAVLERRLPWIGLVVFFPLIFVAIGGGGIWAVWRAEKPGAKPGAIESISQRASGISNLGKKIELAIGLVFTGVGGALSVLLLIIPGVRLVSALDWTEVPATVVSSSVRSWSTDDGMSYAADVLYEYSAGGRTWTSNRRSFFPMNSSDAGDAGATVDAYPQGAEITCFIDPDDVSRSVLDRGFRPAYLIGLFPLVFLLAGIGLTIHSFRSRRTAIPESPVGDTEIAETGGERVLEPAAGPLAKVAGMVFFAAIWNGLVSVFVWIAVSSHLEGNPEWFLTVFIIPFVLVGLGLIVGVVYSILAAFNPRPRLSMTPASPRLGSRISVTWRFTGRPSRISRLTITLEGYESATYRRGTDTHTDREVFASIDLADTTAEWEIAQGNAAGAIPEDTMHSFSSSNNAITWSLHLHGDIARWPDVDESFEIDVRPLPRERLVP